MIHRQVDLKGKIYRLWGHTDQPLNPLIANSVTLDVSLAFPRAELVVHKTGIITFMSGELQVKKKKKRMWIAEHSLNI